MTFITVDLDEPSRFEVVQSWYYLADVSDEVKGRVSSSGEGVHLRADGAGGDMMQEHHRRMAGDDPDRIELDIVRDYRPPQVLFDSKHGQEAGRWIDNLRGLLGEYGRQR